MFLKLFIFSLIGISGHLKFEHNQVVQTLTLDGTGVFDAHPVKVWVSVVEDRPAEARLMITLQTAEPVILHTMNLVMETNYNRVEKIFCNGFQSWSESGEWEKDHHIKKLFAPLKGLFQPYGDYGYHDYTRKNNLHSWFYTMLRHNRDTVTLLASVNDHFAFSNFIHKPKENRMIYRPDIGGRAVSDGVSLADVLIITGTEKLVFDRWSTLLNRDLTNAPPATGWTSWYYYYTKINEATVYENLLNRNKTGAEAGFFQIDDGWQKSVGDWLTVNEKFPGGMKTLADNIRKEGQQPGLWLAPFICEKNSFIFKEKKDWLLKDKKGKPVRAGWNPLWSGSFYALDIYNPEVVAYLESVFDTVLHRWGYDMVKLDFLYAACILPRQDKTRAEIMDDAMILLRRLCGEKLLLACGVPLYPAFGRADYCRIGNDIGLNREFKAGKWLGARERISTYSSLGNTISRRHLDHRFFLNDPDVFILREQKNKLSPEWRSTTWLVNHLFGSLVFTSDNPGEYSPDILAEFERAWPFLKPKVKTVERTKDGYAVSFEAENRSYLALINLGKKPVSIPLPQGPFFESSTQKLFSEKETITLLPGQGRLFYSITGKTPEIIGSLGHIYPGCELEIAPSSLPGTWLLKQKGKPESVKSPVYFLVSDKTQIKQINNNPVDFIDTGKWTIAVYRP